MNLETAIDIIVKYEQPDFKHIDIRNEINSLININRIDKPNDSIRFENKIIELAEKKLLEIRISKIKRLKENGK